MGNSYLNAGGTGNRTTSIVVTTTATIASGNVTMLLNGALTNEFWWTTGQSGREVKFDFGSPRNIIEAKWYQSGISTQGDWKWQGSSDGLAWTDIGTTFTLGTPAIQTITTLAANSNSWRYYRMLQVTGTTNSSPYLEEIEFSIDGPIPANAAIMTQIALMQWSSGTPVINMTQIALEEWGSLAGVQTFSARHV